MFFVTNRKRIYAIIGALAVVATVALGLWGLRFGIDFTGGTIVEVAYVGERPEQDVLERRIAELDMGGFSLRGSDADGYILRMRDVSEAEYTLVKGALSPEGVEMIEKRRATVGPVIGEELRNKALVAIAVVILLIILYVAFAFRNVRTEEEEKEDAPGVSSWTYGLVAIFVLAHDLLIPLGMFAILGNFLGAEVDVLIVMAFLTILGYSVNDTIVIFDRVRENLKQNENEDIKESFADTVGKSLTQTYARSINTSLTTLMVVTALLVFGGPTTTYFALTLVIGILAGTYSSLALAAPLLVTVEAHQHAKKHARAMAPVTPKTVSAPRPAQIDPKPTSPEVADKEPELVVTTSSTTAPSATEYQGVSQTKAGSSNKKKKKKRKNKKR
jgi:preprotein translocase subunit SecF